MPRHGGKSLSAPQTGILAFLGTLALGAALLLGLLVLVIEAQGLLPIDALAGQAQSTSEPPAHLDPGMLPSTSVTGQADVQAFETQFAGLSAVTPLPTDALVYLYDPMATESILLEEILATPEIAEFLPSPVPSLTPFSDWPISIGKSVAGRNIWVHRFGSGPVERMIVAGIHGGAEWNTIALAEQLIAYLRKYPATIPDQVTLYILPSLNPDGEARTHGPDGRVNENGVDLNRNWDAGWRADWPRQGCWDARHTTGGAYPASEPETQALIKFLQEHHVDALISYHSAALGILPSGDPPYPPSSSLAEAIARVSPYPYPPIQTGCLYTGTLVDWAMGLGIAGVDVELRNHYDTDFEINLKVLTVLLTWQP
ncbi:MAG: hypothetical protein JXB15_05075 [Anaerolineales bacterium]|nr:hypothetical protein [Anaerolineales bacterium]